MSDKEQAAIAGETTLRYKHYRQTLACWEAKAEKIADELDVVCRTLRGKNDLRELGPVMSYCPERSEVDRVLNGIRESQEQCNRLKSRLESMGLPVS